MKLTVKQYGDFKNTFNFLKKMSKKDLYDFYLRYYAEIGLQALESATPVDTGLTASSWRYEIHKTEDQVSIEYLNDNVTKYGTPVAILLQYGHGTNNGGYVEGIDYINPALKPIFDDITEAVWKEVTS